MMTRGPIYEQTPIPRWKTIKHFFRTNKLGSEDDVDDIEHSGDISRLATQPAPKEKEEDQGGPICWAGNRHLRWQRFPENQKFVVVGL
jgi:hypothetical protein